MSQAPACSDTTIETGISDTPTRDPSFSGPTPVGQDQKACVLLVDDEDSILSSLKRLLRKEPYDILTTNDAQEALRILEGRRVSLVISDYRMPTMTGTELLLEVQRRWPDTLRIVLSGYSEVKAIISAINEGAVYKFITKPWNDEEIKLHIRRALEQHALQSENRRLMEEVNSQNQRLRDLNEQLDQRAADASMGLTFAQEVLDWIDAGVITIDVTGLVVTTNHAAARLLGQNMTHGAGVSAKSVLPEALWGAIPSEEFVGCFGRVELGGRPVQWRAKCLEAGNERRGSILVMWEELP